MQRAEDHWLLSDADALRYGQALANVMRHFPVQASQKAIDFGALIFAAFTIEMPRIGLSMQNARARRQAAQAQQPGATVYNLHRRGPPHSPPNGASGQSGSPPIADPPMTDGDGMGGDTPFN